MSNVCPKCNSQNRLEATFCDSCGASLPAATKNNESAAENTNGSQAKVNIGGLIAVVLVIAVAWWFLFGDNSKPSTQPAAAGGGGSASTSNPHGGMDTGAAAGAPDDGMNQMMEGIADAKTSLDSNPLDTDALMTLYRTFGTIGREDQIRPRLDAAVEALVAKADSMEPAELAEVLTSITYSAFYGNDWEGAEMALTTVAETAPDNKDILALTGNIYFDMGRVDEALAAYTAYLLEADAETDGDDYWNVRTDRATMLLQSGMNDSDNMKLQEALNEFTTISAKKPNFFNAWFNLGLAYKAVGDAVGAEAAFEACVFLGENEMERWQVQRELAMLRGEDPPPPPPGLAQPGMGGGDTEGGMANPHGGSMGGGGDTEGGMGGGGDTEGGMANPHGGGMGGGGDTEGGMANPHGGS